MKYIDINTMTGCHLYKTRCNTPDELISYLDSYNAYSAVTVHSESTVNPQKYNDEMTDIAKNSGGRIRACLSIDPMLAENSLAGTGDLANRLKTLRPSAVRLYPKTQGYPLDVFFCGHILDVLNALRIPLFIAENEMPDPREIATAAAAYPDLPFVLLRNSFNKSFAPCHEFTP